MDIQPAHDLNLDPKRWAEIFVSHTHPDKLKALQQWFTDQDQKFHSERCQARHAANGFSKEDH